ncbi:sodium:solute symporter family protein [Scandinavium sp. H11S7]|uniref:Sodium:solute symporter family protein n=1 Tax=Scandinavium hiltneri TaxID=2926519 RepID=A0ABT2DY06_9ENTR|nr:sodium:solute symporter family protein [Scandinavium hiltneri]MCS2160508.1 sodium:solute symporter family protein [Scandinavium hiltneri]
MSDSTIVTGITLIYLSVVLWVGIRARGQSGSSLEGYVAGGRHVSVFILFFIIGAEIFSAFTFLGAPGWAYQHGAVALYIFAFISLATIPIWVLGPRAAELGRARGYLTQGDMIADHYRSRPLGILAGAIGVLALVPYLAIQITGAGLLFQAATDGFIPFWLGAFLAFVVVAIYVFFSGLKGIGWTNLLQGIMMVSIAWFLGLAVTHRLFGGVGEMFTQIKLQMPEYLTMPGVTGMTWGGVSTAILVSAFGSGMWPHVFTRFYSADSARSLRQVSVLYPLYSLLLIPLLLIGLAGMLIFAGSPLARPDTVLLEVVLKVANFSPWVKGLMLSGALAAAMSSGANQAHTVAVILTRDILGSNLMRNSSEAQAVSVTRWSVLGLSLVAYAIALFNPVSLVVLLLGAYGVIVQLMPMVLGALFFPSLNRAGVTLGVIVGSLTFLVCQFLIDSPLGWHPGLWGLGMNLVGVYIGQKWLPDTAVQSRAIG